MRLKYVCINQVPTPPHPHTSLLPQDYFENGVQGDGDGDSAGVDVGYQGEVLLEVAPQTKRLRLGNSGMEYSDITL